MYETYLKGKQRCAICFEPKLEDKGIFEMFLTSPFLCLECNIKSKRKVVDLQEFKVETYFEYSGSFRNALLQYKENNDRFLAPLFLHPILLDLKIRFRKHIFICAPSRADSLNKRGFEHLELMLEVYGFKTLKILSNHSPHDQTQVKNRGDIFHYISMDEVSLKADDKVVVFDDVVSSGSTLHACAKLISSISKNLTLIALSSVKK